MRAPTRLEVVAEARDWIDTPWHHQARRRGIGTDCGGLLGGVAIGVGLLPEGWWAAEFDPRFGGYSRQPRGDRLREILALFMDPIEPAAAQPGDVVVMDFGKGPQHVGILAPYRGREDAMGLIHAMSLPPRCVAEHRLGSPWSERVVAAFSYRGIAP